MTCKICGRRTLTGRDRRRYCRQQASQVCVICDKPLNINGVARYCGKCSQQLQRGQEQARKMSPEQKRAMAKAAVKTLLAQGYVRIGFLGKRR